MAHAGGAGGVSLSGMTLTSASLPGWCSPEAVYVARDTLLEIYSLPSWSKQGGLCRGYPQSMFFPVRGASSTDAKGTVGAAQSETTAWRTRSVPGPAWKGYG